MMQPNLDEVELPICPTCHDSNDVEVYEFDVTSQDNNDAVLALHCACSACCACFDDEAVIVGYHERDRAGRHVCNPLHGRWW